MAFSTPPSKRPPSARPESNGPTSKRPGPRSGNTVPPPRAGGASKPPRSVEARLDDALADAEKMARRVESIAEQDAFAASILALEYLARTQHKTDDVNPLEQRGRTDAWTSAFVRLRLLADKGPKFAEFCPDGALYLAARVEERRLHALLGPDAIGTLAKARDSARRSRRRRTTGVALAAMCLVIAGAAAWEALNAVFTKVALGAAIVSAFTAVALLVHATMRRTAIAAHVAEVASIERAMRERAAFESSATGRFVLQKLQQEHPHLLRTGVSAPPPRVKRES